MDPTNRRILALQKLISDNERKISQLKSDIETMNRRCAEEGMNDERKEKLEEEIYDAKATIEEYMLINEGYQSEIEQLQKQPLKVIDSNKP